LVQAAISRAASSDVKRSTTGSTCSIHGLGKHRWVVERTLSWALGIRRLGFRYERRADLLQGLLSLACALICLTFVAPTTM
jgi:transposase